MENKCIQLTLTQQTCILNGLTLKETYNNNNLLLNSSLLKCIENNGTKMFFNTEQSQLNKYQNSQKNGFINIRYLEKVHGWGRVYAEYGLGLCNFRKEIRQTIAKDIYTDIDIVNCHFMILYNLLESNNIKCKYLKKYIDNRDDILNKMMLFFLITKDEAKELFIRFLYFGSFDKWLKDNNIINNFPLDNEIINFIFKFQKELIKNCEILINHNKSIFESIKNHKITMGKTLNNIKSSVCSHILQEFEKRILEKVFIYCCDNGYIKNNNCVLCYDGIMIETSTYKPELLTELQDYIYNELKFKMQFIEKKMTVAYTNEELTETQNILPMITTTQETKKINITLDKLENFDKTKVDILNYFNILNYERTKDKKDTFLLGALIFSLNLGYDLFYKLCYKNHTTEQLKNIWAKYDKTKNNYNINTLHYWCREDNLEKHEQLQKQYNKNNSLNYLIDPSFKVNNKVAFIDDDEPIEKINFESRYLLDQDKLLNDNSLFVQSVLNCKNKTTLIKGPYGIGKTKFLMEYIKLNPNSRILFGSYRVTLTNDLKGNFDKLGFTTYKENINANRVIIQLESLLKLDNNINLFMDEFTTEVPYYDIIILDEIEGILNQLYSPTMNGQAYEIYKYLVNIILNCKKLIVLDGDISSRTHNFIKQFGSSTNLYNNIKINKKRFTICNNRQFYLRDIFQSLDNDKKIVIVCQGANEAKFMKTILSLKYPDKVIKFYYGKTDDKEKDKLINVNDEFDQADILIYTSTIEAGVNYDKKRFYKCYGIFVGNTTSQRAFFQMLARVRHFESDDILILSEKFKYNEFKLYTFDELKNCLKQFNNNLFDEELIKDNDGKLIKCKIINSYGINYIYNLLEHQNKNKTLFLFYFKLIAEHKGHEVTFMLDDNIEKVDKIVNKEMTADIKKLKYNDILNADELNQQEYDIKLKLQEQQKLDEKSKYELQKHNIQRKFGIDYVDDYYKLIERLNTSQKTEEYDKNNYIDVQFLNIGTSADKVAIHIEELLDKFLNVDKIKNLLNIIDIQNYRQDTDDKKEMNLDKLKMIKTLLNDLGFKNVYDKETKITKNELEERIINIKNTNDIFKEGIIKTYFNTLTSNNNIFKSVKSFLGFINSLFINYGFKIVSSEMKRNGQRIYLYSLEFVEYIEEIIHFKLLKGMKMIDSDNIYKYDNSNMQLLHFLDREKYKFNLKKYEDRKKENNNEATEENEENEKNEEIEEIEEDYINALDYGILSK